MAEKINKQWNNPMAEKVNKQWNNPKEYNHRTQVYPTKIRELVKHKSQNKMTEKTRPLLKDTLDNKMQ